MAEQILSCVPLRKWGQPDAEFERIVALGARAVMSPRPSPERGVRMAFVADPEGNLVELLERPVATS